MFIELTDHLRCPADHDEQYLVLLPSRMDGRDVVSGEMGCPACGRVFRVVDGVLSLGEPPSFPSSPNPLAGDALASLVGVSGPGGYLVLVGEPAREWRGVAEALPGVALVAVNPPVEIVAGPGVSVVRSDRLPVKRHSMRGIVLGAGYGASKEWVEQAAGAVLPGLRVVGEGEEPAGVGLDLLATAAGWWVAAKTRGA